MPVSQDHVRSLYLNCLRREPDPGGLRAMCAKNSPIEVAQAIFQSDEFLRPQVLWSFNYWVRRLPVDRELAEWIANYRRLGPALAEWHLSYSPESVKWFDQGTANLPIMPGDQGKLYNLRQYINHCIYRFFGRYPNPPGDTIQNAPDGEWLRFFGGLDYSPGAWPTPRQAFFFVRNDPEAVRFRVNQNYSMYLGRHAVQQEVGIWARDLETQDLSPFIPSSPEGLRHGLTLAQPVPRGSVSREEPDEFFRLVGE